MQPDTAERRPVSKGGALETVHVGDGKTRIDHGADIARYSAPDAGAQRAGSAAPVTLAAYRAQRGGRPSPPRWRQWIGCPCGCESRPPYVDDPACKRHRPMGPAVDYGQQQHDVETLGLAPHNRATCEHCRAVGA